MNATIKLLFFSSFIALSLSVGVFGQSSNISAGCSPLEVNFTAPATSSTYYWDFKDGVTSNLQNPTTVFTTAGTYNVEFKESPTGPVIGTVQIKVFQDPVININVPIGCAPLNAQLQNASIVDPAINVSNYVWVFGDGASSTGPENVSHVYAGIGKYSVSFSIESNTYPTCNRTVIFNDAVEVIAQPITEYITNPTNLTTCNTSLTVGFTSNSTGSKPMSYTWDFGNGVITSTNPPPSQTYGVGSHIATLTTTYTGLVGCVSSYSRVITVGSPDTKILRKKDTVCINTVAAFYTKTPGMYTWDFGPNATVDGPLTDDSLNVIFTTPGEHTVSLKVLSFDFACSTTKTIKIYVDEVTADIVANPTFTCSSPVTMQYNAVTNQTNVKYFWTLPDGDSSKVKTFTKVIRSRTAHSYYGYNGAEALTSTLRITSLATGCFADVTETDSMWVPNALPMPDLSKGCKGLTVQWSDSSSSAPFNKITERTWLFGDGTTLTKTDSLPFNHTYVNAGEYLTRLVVKTEKGCVDTSYAVLIEVGDDISSLLDFTADKTSVCPGEVVQFTAQITAPGQTLIDGYHFSSEGNRVFHCADQTTVPWTYENLTGPQNVSLQVDYNGCYSKITKVSFVNVKGAIAKIDYGATCDSPKEYRFRSLSQGATTHAWTFGDATSSSASNVTHVYGGSGDYSVQLVASDPGSGCPPTSDFATIHVRQVKSNFTLDTIWCSNQPYTLNGSASVDVKNSCYTGYTWQFKGGDIRPVTSANSTLTTSIIAGGYYSVSLITLDVNGCRDTTTKNFRVYDMQPKWVTNPQKICIPNPVQFTDNTTSDTTLVSWKWLFNDVAGTSSTLQNPLINLTSMPFDSSTGYLVFMEVKDKVGCTESALYSLPFYRPFTSIVIADTSLCLGDTVNLSAPDFVLGGSHLNYNWDLGNGQTSTTASNLIKYAAGGTYTAKLKYAEQSSGCKDSTSVTFTVQNYPVASMITSADGVPVLCADANIFYQDASTSVYPYTRSWDFGNGITYTGTDPQAFFYPKGVYNVKYKVATTHGCADSTTRFFNVQKPEGTFTIDRDTICKGEDVVFTLVNPVDVATYTWAFGDGTTVADATPVTHRYEFHPLSGQAPARLILKGVGGICPVEEQKIIYIRQVIADFERGVAGDTTICFNDGPYTFTSTSTNADTYSWNLGDSKPFTTTKDVLYQYDTAGVYKVSLAITNTVTGCVDTITKEAYIYPNPETLISDPAPTCWKDPLIPVQLTVTNPHASSKYLWTVTSPLSAPNTGLNKDTITNPIATIDQTYVYDIMETETLHGCISHTPVNVVIIPKVELPNLDTIIVIGDEVVLPAYGAPYFSFHYTPTTGISCLTCNYPVVKPLEDVLYTNLITSQCDAIGQTVTYKIKVRPDTFVKMPTAFSPNGDGTNDIVYVEGWGIKELLEFTIFNRWGQQIYTSTNLQEGWNGTFNGTIQNSDVYVYKVKVLTWRDKEVTAEGYINLLH